MSTLNKIFKHKRWFLNSNLTNKQVIEYLASCIAGKADFCFKENKTGIVVYGFEDNSTWKPNQEQLNYLKNRIDFYIQYYKDHLGKYDYENDWLNAMNQKINDMINQIPEYKSYYISFKNSLHYS